MAAWCPPRSFAFVAMAAFELAGCKPAGGERQLALAARSSELSVSSSLPSAPLPPSATTNEEEDDCGHLHPPKPLGPQASSAKKLSAPARTRVTTLQVLAHGSAVIVRKEPGGWVMGGPSGCAVSSRRVQRALDNLSSLNVVASREPPQPHDRQIVLLDGAEVLLQYDVGGGAGGADRARLPDGSVVQLRGLDRGTLSSQPRDWCL